MCGPILEQPTTIKDWRRRSADVGGLHLATGNNGQGQGWMGGHPGEIKTMFAEMLSDMYTETLNSVNDNSLDIIPTNLSESVKSRLIHSLDRWYFEPHRLPDEETLACTLLLFEALFRIEGMREAIPLTMQQISAFIRHLRRIYRYENSYHNFEHALDVLQATQSYLKSEGMVPSPTILFEPNRMWKPKKAFDSGSLISSLGLRELFTLYVAAIGHDVGHPGFTNNFMKNAQAPLSVVFDHQSALEHMHCQLLLRVMRHHGLGVLLDDPHFGTCTRRILLYTVLATDMGVHQDFMLQFKRMVEGEVTSLCRRQTIICQAILKNADISNPTRPFMVSKHWANALMQEWTAQALLEEEYQLKQTVMSSNDPLKEAESQIFFISTFAKPLLELTVRAAPNLSMYYHHCKANLQSWHQRKAVLCKQYGSGSTIRQTSSPLSPPPPSSASSASSLPPSRQSDGYHSAFPLTLPNYQPKSDHPARTPTIRSVDHESQPDSPSESESVSSTMFSPISDAPSSYRYPSSISSSNTTQSNIPSSHAAIRAASKSGSLKLQNQKKKGTRNSWCSTSTSGIGLTTLFHPPSSTPMSVSSSSSTSSTPPLDHASSSSSSSSSSSCTRPLVAPPPASAPATTAHNPTTAF
ncbi:HD-domain/PDEase-like protein [Phlegmacium glaucopus]|nr:HD-domain/PDEase-like protein [Phlegmacium glaucopus]